ncbi:HTH_Tnp_Tc3_2 domain-containing protein [Trichonephila clavipes]|nr:HTH_Tnp_Tc3_2 domain-containing protein [Trichonephila clavipes]
MTSETSPAISRSIHIVTNMVTQNDANLAVSPSSHCKCNNRIVMPQRKHLDDFSHGRIIGRLECGRTKLEVSEELGIAQSVISRLWQRF